MDNKVVFTKEFGYVDLSTIPAPTVNLRKDSESQANARFAVILARWVRENALMFQPRVELSSLDNEFRARFGHTAPLFAYTQRV